MVIEPSITLEHVLATPLRGRDRAMATMAEALDRLAGGDGGVVVVEGAGGSGKSRLLRDTAHRAVDREMAVAQGMAEPEGQAVSLGPLLEALSTGPSPLLGRQELARLSRDADDRFWLMLDLQEHLERSALNHPLVIVVDDLQWADPETLLALRVLPTRLRPHAILWIVALRDNDRNADLDETRVLLLHEGALHVRLERLMDGPVAQVVRDLLGVPPSATLLEAARMADGLPFLLVEWLRGMCEDGLIAIENGLATVVRVETPRRYADLAGRQIARLTSSATQFLQVGAAFGRSFSVVDVASMLGVDEHSLMAPLREAIAAGVLVERGSALSFQHDLARESVVASIPSSLNKPLRRKAVDIQLSRGVPLAEVAVALSETAEAADPVAIGLLRRAAAETATRSPSAAADLSVRALGLVDRGTDDHPILLAETIALLWQAGRASDAKTMAESALAGRLPVEIEGQIRLASAVVAGQMLFSEGVHQCREGLKLAGISEKTRLDLTAMLSLNLANMGDLEECDLVVSEGLRTARELGDDEAEALLLSVDSVVAFYRRDWLASLALLDDYERLSQRLDFADRLWVSESWRAFLGNAADRGVEALERASRGLMLAERSNQSSVVRMWMMVRSRILLDIGRIDDARAESEALIGLDGELGSGNFADATAGYALGRVSIWADDVNGMRRAGVDAKRMANDDSVLMRGVGAWMQALLADARGDYAEAMRVTLEASSRFDTSQGPVLCSPMDATEMPEYVRMALNAGDRRRAEKAASRAEALSAANPSFTLLAACASHARGLIEESAEILVKAVDLFEGSGRPIPQASALEDAADSVRLSDPISAAAWMARSHSLYLAAGDVRDASRTRRKLDAMGVARSVEPVELGKRGWETLTESELNVVRIVAGGATNKAAAAQLFLSPHTVNTHLRHAFAKLEIKSRVQLARVVLAHDRAVGGAQ